MQTLVSAFAEAGGAGEPLPGVWPDFVQEGVEFRRGQITLIGAAPGGAKSVLALTLAARAGVPTLYQSADTNAFTTGVRLAAMCTGDSVATVEQALNANPDLPRYGDMMRLHDHIQWDFSPNPSIDDVTQNVLAFEHLFGTMPHLIVVDNLRNMWSAQSEEVASFKENMELLNILASESKAAVVVLHHLTGEYESGDVPPPQGAFEGKIAKLPGLALTMFKGRYNDIGVCVVKNRFGAADQRGKAVRVYLPADLERMKLG